MRREGSKLLLFTSGFKEKDEEGKQLSWGSTVARKAVSDWSGRTQTASIVPLPKSALSRRVDGRGITHRSAHRDYFAERLFCRLCLPGLNRKNIRFSYLWVTATKATSARLISWNISEKTKNQNHGRLSGRIRRPAFSINWPKDIKTETIIIWKGDLRNQAQKRLWRIPVRWRVRGSLGGDV